MSRPQLDQIGGYRVLEYLNEGGMAWVFKVQHPNLDRQLALKLLKTAAGSGDEVRLFKREIDQLTKATHPNLVWILDQGQDPQSGSFWYAMEYLAGDTVRQRVARDGPMEAEEAVKLFTGLLSGLETLHARNVVHRDIKPSNIMIEPGNQAKLMDLGIARVIEGDGAEEVSYTNANVVRGTPAYMAPEQSAAKDLTPAADIFAVGLTLYYALTGHTVYEDVDDVDSTSAEDIRGYLYYLDRQHQNLQLKLAKAIPRGLQDVVRKATQTEPSARYQTAAEMRIALEGALAPRRRGGWKIALAAVLVGAALFFAGPRLLDLLADGGFEIELPVPTAAPEVAGDPSLDAAREAARAAEAEARDATVVLQEYEAQWTRATLALTKAEELAAGDPAAKQKATAAFKEASGLFLEAAAVGAANERRKEAMALESQKREEGVSDFKRWEKMKRSAELSYRTHRYRNAEDDFAKGIAYLDMLAGNAAPRVEKREPAEAVAAGKRGQVLSLRADAVDPEGGEISYAWSVDGAEQPDAVGPAFDFRPSAGRHELSVEIGDAQGRTTTERWTVTGSSPLKLVSATPTQKTVAIERGETVTLAVEATGSGLRHKWTLDGSARKETGSELRFEAVRSSTAKVVIQDDSGATQSRSWQISVTQPERQPTQISKPKLLRVLSRSPQANEITVEPGESVDLRIAAAGDDLVYLWRVGDEVTRTGDSSLTLTPSQDQQVEVTVEDKHGQNRSERWNLVLGEAVAQPQSAEPTQATIPSATPADLAGRFESLLRDFQAAYQSCQKENLVRLWQIPPADDARWRYSLCRQEFVLRLGLVAGSAVEDAAAGSARACIDWVLERGTRGPLSKQVTMRVTLGPDGQPTRIDSIADGCPL